MLHDGDYPHLSTPVTYLKPGFKRVILGFNAFPAEVGECSMRAPEHSDAFNRTIKLYQTMAALGVPITASTPHGGGSDGLGKYSNPETAMSATNTLDTTVESGACASGTTQVAPAPASKGMNVKDIMKNPALAKLLVTAAKKLKEKLIEEAKELKIANNQVEVETAGHV
jgi:hypothetical protein